MLRYNVGLRYKRPENSITSVLVAGLLQVVERVQVLVQVHGNFQKLTKWDNVPRWMAVLSPLVDGVRWLWLLKTANRILS